MAFLQSSNTTLNAMVTTQYPYTSVVVRYGLVRVGSLYKSIFLHLNFLFDIHSLLEFSGVDVIALIERLRAPDYLQKKVKAMPPSAGTFVVALLLYKVKLILICFK